MALAIRILPVRLFAGLQALEISDDERPLVGIALAVVHVGAGMGGLGVLDPRIEGFLLPHPAALLERVGIGEARKGAGLATVGRGEIGALPIAAARVGGMANA